LELSVLYCNFLLSPFEKFGSTIHQDQKLWFGISK